MPVFLVERNFAEQLQVTPDGAASINRVNAEIGVQWLISFPERRQEEDLLPV
jgi:hypothetical protein